MGWFCPSEPCGLNEQLETHPKGLAPVLSLISFLNRFFLCWWNLSPFGDGWVGKGAYKDLVSEGFICLPGKIWGEISCFKCGERLYSFMAYPSIHPSIFSLFFHPPPSIHLYCLFIYPSNLSDLSLSTIYHLSVYLSSHHFCRFIIAMLRPPIWMLPGISPPQPCLWPS